MNPFEAEEVVRSRVGARRQGGVIVGYRVRVAPYFAPCEWLSDALICLFDLHFGCVPQSSPTAAAAAAGGAASVASERARFLAMSLSDAEYGEGLRVGPGSERRSMAVVFLVNGCEHLTLPWC
jgi:hypothetical protein